MARFRSRRFWSMQRYTWGSQTALENGRQGRRPYFSLVGPASLPAAR